MSKTYECWEKKWNDNLGYGAVRTKLLPRLDYQPLFGNRAYLKPRLRQIVPRAKFPLNFCFTAHYFYPKISRSTLLLSLTVVLGCINLPIIYFEKFST